MQKTPRGALPGGLPGSWAAAVTASLQESRETGTTGVHRPGDIGGRDTVAAKISVQEVQEEPCEEDMEMSSGCQTPVLEVRKEAVREDEGSSSDEGQDVEAPGDHFQWPWPEKNSQLGHKDREEQVGRKNRKTVWEPPEGMRRCGQKCAGCAAKCTSLGQEECSSCQMNRVKETTKNVCLSRGPCLNVKEQRPHAERSRKKTKIPGQRETSSKSLPRSRLETERKSAMTIKVGQQTVLSRVDLVKDSVENIEGLEKEEGKRCREESGQTPENEKKASKIAVLKTNTRESMTVKRGSTGGLLPPLL